MDAGGFDLIYRVYRAIACIIAVAIFITGVVVGLLIG